MSFGEIFLIGIIALIILGPERLPKAARTVGLWVGKAKQSFESIKDEIDRELKVKELQEQLEEQLEEQKKVLETEMGANDIENLKEQLTDTANTIHSGLSDPLTTEKTETKTTSLEKSNSDKT
jgi:sec-independent protein translocase protein TatB